MSGIDRHITPVPERSLNCKLHITIENRRSTVQGLVCMPYPQLSDEEIIRSGKELYEKHIRSQVETAENIGKLISINVETGEYEIGDDLLVTSRRLQAKQPDAAIWAERIGYDAVYAVGGSLFRTAH